MQSRAPTASVRRGRPRLNERERHRWAAGSLSMLLLAAAFCGCSGSGPALLQVAGHMTVTLQDFKLSTSTVDLPAGRVTFAVTNDGPSTHEFNVDRTKLAADALPIDTTGLFVAENSPLLKREGSVESAGLATRHNLTLTLTPGTYVVYCDLEGHYLSGMHVKIRVH